MSEINGPKISVNQVNYSGIQRQNNDNPVETKEENTPKLNDFGDPKAEALGRSMLFKGTDDISHDLKALLDNPQIAENSDKNFNAIYKIAQEAGLENPYEEAASFSTTSL